MAITAMPAGEAAALAAPPVYIPAPARYTGQNPTNSPKVRRPKPNPFAPGNNPETAHKVRGMDMFQQKTPRIPVKGYIWQRNPAAAAHMERCVACSTPMQSARTPPAIFPRTTAQTRNQALPASSSFHGKSCTIPE